MLRNHVSRNNSTLNLIGSLKNLEDTDITIELFQRIILHVTIPAKNLQRIVYDFNRRISGIALSHGAELGSLFCLRAR